MLHVIWEFVVPPDKVNDFERHYAGNGTWAQFFRQDPAYQGTVLVRDRDKPGHYLTADKWADFTSYERFKSANQARYKEIDAGFEALTSSERLIGHFEELA